MKIRSIIGHGALVLAAVTAFGAPANAVITTFATFSPVQGAANMHWQKTGTASGDLFTIASPDSTTTGSTATIFNFLQAGLAQLGGLSASFTFEGSSTNSPAFLNNGFLVQPVVSGSFSFIYNGVAPLVLNGMVFNTGANLLSGVFSNAAIFAQEGATSGSISASSPNDGTISYDSDFLDFTGIEIFDFGIGLTAITPFIARADALSSLDSFKATASGNFSSDPAPMVGMIPEPATWALMIAGFGLVGAAARRRKPTLATVTS